MRTFILADNQYISRQGIQCILQTEKWADNVLYANNKEELHRHLKNHPSAIVVLDYSTFDFTSAAHLLISIEAAKESFWVLFSEELSLPFLRQVVFSASVHTRLSVVLKHDAEEEIKATLQNAVNDQVYLCEAVQESINHTTIPPEKVISLTKTEKIMLREIAQGKTTKQIAWEKHVSFHTVNSHRKNIFRKLEVNNVQEAIRYAVRAGLLDTSDYYI